MILEVNMGKIQNMRQYYDIKTNLDIIRSTSKNPYITRYAKYILNDLDIILNINLGKDNYLVMKDNINTMFSHMWSKHKVFDQDPELEDMVHDAFCEVRESLQVIFNYYDEVCHYDNTII